MRKTLLTSLLLPLLAGGMVSAHASLVFGELTTSPETPDPAAGFNLRLHMMDPVRTPIEDATVAAEFRLLTTEEFEQLQAAAPDSPPTPEQVEAGEVEVEIPEGDWRVFDLTELGPGGNYAADIRLPGPGTYQVIMRDTTYPQEDAVAELLLDLDGSLQFEPALFIFPPTDIGGASLGTWLAWLIAIPLAAGVLVTVFVLRGKPVEESGKTAS